MKRLKINVLSNGREKIHPSGRFIRVITATAGFDVSIDNSDDIPLSVGASIIWPATFSQVEIINNNASLLTVELLVGDAIYNEQAVSGIVQVDSFITDPQVQGITDPLTPQEFKATDTPYVIASSTSSSLYTAVAPAANINGIIVKAISSTVFNGYQRVMSKNAAPVSINDASAFVLSHGYSYAGSGGANVNVPPAVPLPFKIPAGHGLYHWFSGSNFYLSMVYEIL